jgi:hypothetical protein
MVSSLKAQIAAPILSLAPLHAESTCEQRHHVICSTGSAFTVAWSNAGVTELILSDNGVMQGVRASVSAGAARRFPRMRITK